MDKEMIDIIAQTVHTARENPGMVWGLWVNGLGWARDSLGCLILNTDPYPIIAHFHSRRQEEDIKWRPRMVKEWVESFLPGRPERRPETPTDTVRKQ